MKHIESDILEDSIQPQTSWNDVKKYDWVIRNCFSPSLRGGKASEVSFTVLGLK